MSLSLRDFQVEGARFLASRPRALLADQQGVGKTPQVIRALGAKAHEVLVVGPAISRTHWRKEFARWSRAPHFAHCISYEDLRKDLAALAKHQWDVLVVDECHYTKNPSALRTQGVWGKNGVAPSARVHWALSGTPAPNGYNELWPMLRAWGVWKGTYNDFKYRYCTVDATGKVLGKTKDPDKVRELRGLLDGIMLRRLKKDVMPELPPLDVQPYFVEGDPSYIGTTRGTVVNSRAQIVQANLEEKKLAQVLSTLTPDEALAYLNGHAAEFATLRRLTGIMKVPAVFNTIRFELERKLLSKVVVYAYHVDVIKLLQTLLDQADIPNWVVYGGTNHDKRDRHIDSFRKRTRGVFIGQIQAAGTVIDLTCAHQGILLERDWVPGNNAQALERMHRYGQDKAVTIRDVVLPGSVDEIIYGVNLRKMSDLSDLFDRGN